MTDKAGDIQQALAAYKQAQLDAMDHRAKHAAVLEEQQYLDEAVDEAKGTVKRALLDHGVDFVETGDYEARIIQRTNVTYDYELLPAAVKRHKELFRVEVKRKELEDLVKSGVINGKGIDKARIESKAAPYVQIKPKTG